MNKIGQLSKFCLRKSPHVRASLCLPTETGSWLCKVPSPVLTSQPVRTIYVEDLPQSETPVIGSPTENRLKDINFPPFIKSLYCGEFNKSVLAYAEVVSFDRYYVLQKQVDQLKKFMEENKEIIDSIEERGVVPEQLIKKLEQFELTGLLVPKKYGGAELLKTEVMRLYQELGQSLTLAELYRINEMMCTRAIVLHGTEEQKQKYLEPISLGQLWTATCIAEKNAGSDPLSIETTGKLKEDGMAYHLKGTKTWVANAIRADLFLVFGQVNCHDYLGNDTLNLTAFLVDRNTPGVEISKPYNLTALNGLQVCDVTLDCEVPVSAVLGEPGTGHDVYQSINHDIKLYMGAAIHTRLKTLLDKTIKHCHSRWQYGKKLAEYELINLQIAKCSSYVFALESMLYLTSGLADVGLKPDTELESAVVKEFAAVASDYVTNACMKILGAQTVLADAEWQRYVAESQVLNAWQGTSNVSKCFIGITGILSIIELKGEDIREYQKPKVSLRLAVPHQLNVNREVYKIFPKRYKIDENVHPRLGNIASQVDEASRRLHLMAEMMLKTHGLNIQIHERNLEILADFTMEVYAMICTLSRCSRAYCVGHQHSELEINLAIPFIAESKERTDRIFKDFMHMSNYEGFPDFFYMEAGEYIMKRGNYCPVNPLTKNTY